MKFLKRLSVKGQTESATKKPQASLPGTGVTRDVYPSKVQLQEILNRLNTSAKLLQEAAENLDQVIDNRIDYRFSKIENKVWRGLALTGIALGSIVIGILRFCKDQPAIG